LFEIVQNRRKEEKPNFAEVKLVFLGPVAMKLEDSAQASFGELDVLILC